MKAILEIEMPISCTKCSLYYKRVRYVETRYMCAALGEELPYSEKAETQRYSGCLLKPVIAFNAERGKYATYTTVI